MNTNYSALKDKIKTIARACHRLPEEIKLVAVSKTHSAEEIIEVYEAGCRDFGENKIQEGLTKIPNCPQDIFWHFIGTLQGNKVMKAIQSFQLIHSVDTPELAEKISEASVKLGKTTSILLQVNISGEHTKHGMDPEGWRRCLERVNQLPNLCLRGLMTMAPLAEDEYVIRSCFSALRKLKEEFVSRVKDPSTFSELSMGMSNDYPIAIQEGATILRIGTALFGAR